MLHDFYVSFHTHGVDAKTAKKAVERSLRDLGAETQVREVSMKLIKELAAEHGMSVSLAKVDKTPNGMEKCPDCVLSGISIWYVPDGDGGLRQRVCKRCAGLGFVPKPKRQKRVRQN